MPIYEYENKSGARILLFSSVKDRNKPRRVRGSVFKRSKNVVKFNVAMGALPHGAMADTIKGYYNEEIKHGAKFKSEFTKDEIKKAWSAE